MAGYTPGPWESRKAKFPVDGEYDFAIGATVDGKRECIAEAFGRCSTTAFPPAEANARLIAAAPDLLEALEAWRNAQQATDDAVEHFERAVAEGWHNDPSGSCWVAESDRLADSAWARALTMRDAAIAKAKGAA